MLFCPFLQKTWKVNVKNCHPVSLLPIYGKTFEKLYKMKYPVFLFLVILWSIYGQSYGQNSFSTKNDSGPI